MARPPKEPTTPATYAQAVGAEVRAKRMHRGLTAQDCADAAGVALQTWYSFELGKLTLDRLPMIAAALGCSIRSLLPASWEG